MPMQWIATAAFALEGIVARELRDMGAQNVEAQNGAVRFEGDMTIPLAGFSAFLLDGIFIGATATHLMLRAMIVASGCFFLIYYGFKGTMENHALWMAFITYLLLRGVLQGVLGRKILGYYPFRQKQPAK